MTGRINLEQHLINGIKKGDEAAAFEVYQRYSKAMYNTLLRLVGNEDDAKDLLQEAFVTAFEKIHSFRADATFGAWLKRIVVNTGLMHLRKKKISFEPIENVTSEATFDQEDVLEVDITLVNKAIQQLPDGCRTVLTMYLVEQYSHKEIAAQLEISISTSKTQYMRAKTLLKDMLKETLYG